MSITYKEQYEQERRWSRRAIILATFHLTHRHLHGKKWTLQHTANYFSVSIGMISESLKLAHAIDLNPELLKCETREQALRKVK